jgi:hypothetical protein
MKRAKYSLFLPVIVLLFLVVTGCQRSVEAAPPAGSSQAPDKHIVQIVHGSSTFPYLNMQQSPQPDRPSWTFEFTITDGPPILPPLARDQGLTMASGAAPEVSNGRYCGTEPISAPVGTSVILKGSGLPATGETGWYFIGL